jgi:tyrosinase
VLQGGGTTDAPFPGEVQSFLGATAQGAAKWRRVNISDPATPQAVKDRVLGSYKKAIRAMLALPPDNPLNWYRNALIHTVDCPHGNWWFLVWHRGYIGWFEKKCRELSGDPEFALPYWDWTKQPFIPPEMFDDVLDPNNAGFIAKHDDFKSTFKDAVRKLDYWVSMADDLAGTSLAVPI